MTGPRRIVMDVDTKAIEPMFVADEEKILAEMSWSFEKYGGELYKQAVEKAQKKHGSGLHEKIVDTLSKILKPVGVPKSFVEKVIPKNLSLSFAKSAPPNPTLKNEQYGGLGCCLSYSYQASGKQALEKKTTIQTHVEKGLSYEGGVIKVLDSGHVVITESKGVMSETKIIDVRCIEHIEFLSAPKKDLYLYNCCSVGCCGKFPELRDRIVLMASDRTTVQKMNCCWSWFKPCTCSADVQMKQIIADIPVDNGNALELMEKIRELQKSLTGGDDGRCFQVLDVTDTQGRLFTRGKVKVLSPEGCVELPTEAVRVKDPAEILMMNESQLIKFIESRGGTLLPKNEMPYVVQAQRLYESQQCERFAEDEIPRDQDPCCKCICGKKKSCCIPPLFQVKEPATKFNRKLYYTTQKM